MTVFIAHAEADREAAEALGKFLERRGLFVEMETGERGFRHVQWTDTVVALWSKGAMFSPYRLLFEKRTLEAWAEDQLVMVKLDHAFAPVGLRDLKAIDASFDKQRDIAWAAVTKTAQDLMKRPREPAQSPDLVEDSIGWDHDDPGDREVSTGGSAADDGSETLRSSPRRRTVEPNHQRSRGSNAASKFVILLLAALIVAATTYAGFIVAANYGIDTAFFVPEIYQPWLPIGGAAAAFLLIALIGAVFIGGRRKEISTAPHDPNAPTVFVSYAHADNTAVLPVVEAVQAQGRNVWIDKQGLAGGDSWAGEIVRAIKGARGVIVMCSKHAFESDHVKRELYLADRYKKPMVPIFIEAAPPPEDFEYFFAGVQWLELHKTAPADRPAALAKALKAV